MIQLRDYQERSVNEIWQWMRENKGNPLGVLPTGAGKSLINAQLVSDLVNKTPPERRIRVLCLTHSKELIEQNSGKLQEMSPHIDFGIMSAGLGRVDSDNQVIFGGIMSVVNRLDELGKFDVCIVDEAHRIPTVDSGTYRLVLNHFLELNPDVFRVIGLTATPYRLDGGWLYEGEEALFDAIATEVTIPELLERGYLSPMLTPKSKLAPNMKGVRKNGGDYSISQAAERMMENDLTELALTDVVARSANRNSWLIFAVNIEHCYMVAKYLRDAYGIYCAVVTGETPEHERRRILRDFKSKEIQAVVNCEVLTTGVDVPNIDVLVMLRPTESTALYQQMAGRALRICEGKTDALLLDYAGNVIKHGPLDDPTITKGGPPSKPVFCPKCDLMRRYGQTHCVCGYEWPETEERSRSINLDPEASTQAVISGQATTQLWKVMRITTNVLRRNGYASIQVNYFGIDVKSADPNFSLMYVRPFVREWVQTPNFTEKWRTRECIKWVTENIGDLEPKSYWGLSPELLAEFIQDNIAPPVYIETIPEPKKPQYNRIYKKHRHD